MGHFIFALNIYQCLNCKKLALKICLALALPAFSVISQTVMKMEVAPNVERVKPKITGKFLP